MNSGSIPIVMVSISLNFIIMFLLVLAAKLFYQKYWCRRIGMRASQDLNLLGQINKIYLEAYTEIFLAAGLTCVAIMGTVDAEYFAVWFWTASDATNSIVSFICILAMLLIPLWLFSLGKRLNDPAIKETYGDMYETINVNYRSSRYYLIFLLIKRAMACITLFVLDGYA